MALAKHFRNAGIPLPRRGYWAKRDAGKAPPRIALPPRALGQSFGIDFGRDREAYWPERPPEEVAAREIPPLPEFEGDLDAVRRCASELAGTVRFSSLATLHPAAAKLLEADEERRNKQAASKWPSLMDAPIFDSKPERRRLRIVNALLLALSRCGCQPSADRWAGYRLHATVGDVGVGFNLAPLGFKREDYDRNHWAFPNKGTLKLALTWYQPPPEITVSWEGSDAVPLERQLTDIVVGILVAGEWSLRRGLIRRHAYLVESKAKAVAQLHRRAEEAMRMERERREEVERERRETLIAEAESWRRAVDLRAYVEARLNTVAGAATEEGMKAWAQWALAEADRLDPLRCAPGRAAEPNPSDNGAK